MWLYSGPMDESRVNVAELYDKELLDEVRRLTHFSQHDSIPLLSLQMPYDSDHQPAEVLSTTECFPNVSDENLEEGDSTSLIESYAEENEMFEDEDNDPANPEALTTDHRSFADELSDTAESNHDNHADHAPFVDAASEKTTAQPPKRSSGGFADEDDLLEFDEGFIEPPSKKAKESPNRPTPAASEASARAAATTTQPSTASSLSKGKENTSPAATAVPPSSAEKPDIQTVISALKGFASQFSSLEADKIRLQEEVESTSSKLDNAVKFAAAARQNADSLKKELDQLKRKLKEEEKERVESEAQRKEKDGLLRQSTLALLGKLPDNSSVDALSMAIESGDLIHALLQKNKGVMSRLHAMIFPKADQEKSLEQLMDTFVVDIEGTIEVAPVPSFAEGSLANASEHDRLQHMKTRILQLEQDMRGLHAMATIIKKKGELAIDAERY
ncbi:hypothetical protein QYE76_037889 [Lolium multiflorum]|uniref:Uncharacterized protein n=1 Tax=Lolium multiflorum TaxID=4521 RepID=A0AAD8WSE3_LOLMU|nr:hypothetical protein QYE76_037889 [Lolium multiflorum]